MPEKSIEEIKLCLEGYRTATDGIEITYYKDRIIELFKSNERKQRDEAVKAERERIWTEVSLKTPILLANYPRGKRDNYNTGRIDGWNICKGFIKSVITPTEDNQK